MWERIAVVNLGTPLMGAIAHTEFHESFWVKKFLAPDKRHICGN